MPTFKYQKKNISYTDQGKGKAVVLLHGFTESQKIWKEFAARLAKKYRVITMDLPGHGKSDTIETVHTMELMADVVAALLRKLKTGKCLLAGHSMGGYVALAFLEKYPERVKGLSLFHSHCFADNSAEKENRNRTINIVSQDKFSYVAQFIPSLFPVEVHKKYSNEISGLIRSAAKMHRDGLIAALEGMKNRKDQLELLKKTDVPVQFILGIKDTRVPVARVWEMISLPAVSRILLLRDTGHMGYIEAPEETFEALSAFAKHCL